MGYNTPDPYHQPEHFGLVCIGEVEWAEPCYSFDFTVVWWHAKHRQFYVGSDAGCSCPSPFDNATLADLDVALTPQDVANLLDEHHQGKYSDRAYAEPGVVDLKAKVMAIPTPSGGWRKTAYQAVIDHEVTPNEERAAVESIKAAIARQYQARPAEVEAVAEAVVSKHELLFSMNFPENTYFERAFAASIPPEEILGPPDIEATLANIRTAEHRFILGPPGKAKDLSGGYWDGSLWIEHNPLLDLLSEPIVHNTNCGPPKPVPVPNRASKRKAKKRRRK